MASSQARALPRLESLDPRYEYRQDVGAALDELRRTCFVKPAYDFDFGRVFTCPLTHLYHHEPRLTSPQLCLNP